MSLEVGTHVWTSSARRRGHNRLPRYLRAKPGTVVRTVGAFALPDENVGDAKTGRRCMLYTVAFAARDLFGDVADDATIYADLFEPYLRWRE